MSNEKGTVRSSRRDFLKRAGLAVGAAGAATAAGASESVVAATGAEPPPSKGYRETEHVRTYYDLARF